MPSERGEYRPIYVALLDGPDFQSLAAEERWVLVTLKLSLGMLGIAVLPGLESAVAERTGYTVRRVIRALQALERDWIEREKNVAWLIRGFKFEPSMSPSNQLHRTSVRRLVDALPRLAIVDRFRGTYPEWFDIPSTNGLREAIEGHSKPSLNTETETETETQTQTNNDDGVRALADQMAPEGASALEGYLRAVRDPARLVLELRSYVNGSHGPGGRAVTPTQLGRALHEMALAGAAMTSKVLSAFVRRVLEPDPPSRNAKADDGLDEYERVARKLEAQERVNAG